MQRPATPPIRPAFPPKAGMQGEGVSVLFAFLALHLLHQRHEAVGVECRTVELTRTAGFSPGVFFEESDNQWWSFRRELVALRGHECDDGAVDL